ncbi:hypothetical protein Verru16b_01101 [Lacunisphaera limnophila]|uniref:Beta/gamma crystallin 'Greek key' domain-containing protein n=1 Tax=Lacunisphaera limnophila TaxID=1838286 RepID=A0A1D8AT55_9BACT|nr:hypothetical protein [Lacunisphaera limnophila]AOS44040.1 hypothetical protein Verru16b_01101 [Lacunisphaera limnophila]
MKTRLLVVLFALLTTTQADSAGDRQGGREDGNRRYGGRVIVYEKVGFRGDALVLYPGDDIENMSGVTFENGARLNDGISSIRIEGDVELIAYADGRFRGDALRVAENTRDLTGRPVVGSVSLTWNDRISSLRVERSRGRDRDRDPSPGRPRPDPEKIIKATFNDYLGREPRPDELRDFRSRFIDQGWTEAMLREHLRGEKVYRTEAAEMIVRRAYLDVLGREVDPSGLRQFTSVVLRRGWTESDVRDELRRSAEYRNKPKK